SKSMQWNRSRPQSKWHNRADRAVSRDSWGGAGMRLQLFSRIMMPVLGLLFAPLAFASAVERINAHTHLGVATCSNSVCHGATQKFQQSNVWQSEFARWQEFDPHATKALQALRTPQGQAIARKLGIGDPTQAKECLDCHADNVPTDKRGERFQASDGAGREACHGGAEHWL